MTGMYPSRLHQNRNQSASFAPAYPGEPLLITHLLQAAGYRCGLVGKLDLAAGTEPITDHNDYGYSFVRYSSRPDLPDEPGSLYHEWLRRSGHDPALMLGNRATERHGVVTFLPPETASDTPSAELHHSTWCADQAIEFIQHKSAQPWLLTLNLFDPHPPYDPPLNYYRRFDSSSLPEAAFRDTDINLQADLSDVEFQTEVRSPNEMDIQSLRAAYLAMIELADEQIGRVLDAVDQSAPGEQTLIVFTSDHGDLQGDHGLVRKGCRFNEGLIRVPLLWSWPGHVQPGLVSDALVELTDIVPTLLSAVELPLPRRISGRSLLRILTGAESPDQHRDFVRSEFYDAQGWQPKDSRITAGTMYRDERWKLTLYHSHGTGELYDLKNDPQEFDNLWDNSSASQTKVRLMESSFAATVLGGDIGPPLIE